VRLRGSYVIRADEAIKDADGNIVELRCSYDPDTLGKNPEGRKVKGVIHWVPAAAAASSAKCACTTACSARRTRRRRRQREFPGQHQP
jgi:hypothetical protein